DRRPFEGKLTCLHASHVEEILDEAVHVARRALDRIGRSSRSALGLEAARPKELRLHDDAVQRIAEIVSDDAEHVIASLDGSSGGAMQASILEEESGPSSKLLRNAQVLGAIHARLDGRQEERPQTLVTQAERHPDDGPW